MAGRDVVRFEVGDLEVVVSAAQPPGFSRYGGRREVLFTAIVELVKLYETWGESGREPMRGVDRIDADHLELTLQAIGHQLVDAAPPFDPREVFVYLMRGGLDSVRVGDIAADLDLVEAEVVRHLREGHVPGWALVTSGDLTPYATREF